MIKNSNFKIIHRILFVLFYLLLFIAICVYFSGDFSFIRDSGDKYNILFISSAFLLIFGIYITEPFFTKPVDVITNSSAILITLISIQNPNSFIGFKVLLYTSIVLCISSIILIFSYRDRNTQNFQRFLFQIIVSIGQSKVLFSALYLLTTISYFRFLLPQFLWFLGFWIFFIFRLFEFILLNISKGWENLFKKNIYRNLIGEAIGCENPFLYQVETDYEKHGNNNIEKGDLICVVMHDSKISFGIIANEKQLINKKWFSVYLLALENEPFTVNFKESGFNKNFRSIFKQENSVFKIALEDIEDEKIRNAISENSLYNNRLNIVGYVYKGSNIDKIVSYSLLDSKNPKNNLLKEGTVIKTEIYGQEVLYQIIDGQTNKENLENHDSVGFITAISRKLGSYDQDKFELNSIKWMPDIYSPIYFLEESDNPEHKLSIGRLPETNFYIPIMDINSLITHNTAILGILGIGKSRLTFELLKKIIDFSSVRIICLDITNEYKKELPNYIDKKLIRSDDESIFHEIDSKYDHIHIERDANNRETKNYLLSGNITEYRQAVRENLMEFLFNSDKIPDDKKFSGEIRVRIYNPDFHKASKGEKVGFNVITTDLTQAEKTRVISTELYKIMMKLGLNEDQNARVLLVFEEAHSLVPEWNSTANDGDNNAVNGTAKIILQGRKYGLGSLVITQRTANICKSILNQCNTIFALRVFDDTGKQFLENYIGEDYSNTLANLPERHSIVVGKALKLKQPVIIKLNDMKDIMIKKRLN